MRRIVTMVLVLVLSATAKADVTITDYGMNEANTLKGWVLMGRVNFTGDINTSYNVTLLAQSATTNTPNEWTVVSKITATTDANGNCSVSELDLNGPAPAGDPNNGYRCIIYVTGIGSDPTQRSTQPFYLGPDN